MQAQPLNCLIPQNHNSILLLLVCQLTGCASAYESIVSLTVTTDANDLGGKLATKPAHSCAYSWKQRHSVMWWAKLQQCLHAGTLMAMPYL